MDETTNGRRKAIVTKQPHGDADSIELRNWATPSSSSKEGSASNHNRRIQRALQDLQGVDEINIRQTLETIGSSCTGSNAYHLVTREGDVLLNAFEETTCCSRCWCGPARSFRMSIQNAESEEILQVVRPHRCDACCCPCCLMKSMVQTPGGYVLGYTKQNWSLCGAVFTIINRNGHRIAGMESPCCPCRCCTNIDISILSRNGEEGAVTKRWGGRKHNTNMDHEFFVLNFPSGTDLQTKGLLLGSAFLVDYMFFEMT
ncbi:phospholipid scramblase 1 [Strongylocentrotus purpuratus]|uniref:Phospholipid scramblase n=1 Tax=Strongylocentrotus purpuratus TaxID=7668 RepID=A0A7M7GGB8_STRPU|nr:phospholipid scramblase 1 [Strongylocentrotus purpuratus]|eukprot:XP_003724469.2 PREDICTED: phospholipid scramblase 1 [Strongylocentrotus purpuratus]